MIVPSGPRGPVGENLKLVVKEIHKVYEPLRNNHKDDYNVQLFQPWSKDTQMQMWVAHSIQTLWQQEQEPWYPNFKWCFRQAFHHFESSVTSSYPLFFWWYNTCFDFRGNLPKHHQDSPSTNLASTNSSMATSMILPSVAKKSTMLVVSKTISVHPTIAWSTNSWRSSPTSWDFLTQVYGDEGLSSHKQSRICPSLCSIWELGMPKNSPQNCRAKNPIMVWAPMYVLSFSFHRMGGETPDGTWTHLNAII